MPNLTRLYPAARRFESLPSSADQHENRTDQAQIAVIYTGGTIGMIESEKGLVPGDKMPERLLKQLETLPEARLSALPTFDLVTLPRLIDSSNATPQDWLELNRLIRNYT
ncbi:asparaginase domain-containing protein, partial [Oceanospirillum sp. HFRX-1_2]